MSVILTDVKKLLGIVEDYKAFDKDIVLHINSSFSRLRQLGVGDQTGFKITEDGNETWDDFLATCSEAVRNELEELKSYMYLSVRLIFDPPQQNHIIDSYKELIKEFEWRMNLTVEMAERVDDDG